MHSIVELFPEPKDEALNQRIKELEAKLKQTYQLHFKKYRIDYFITENISAKRDAPKVELTINH